MTDLIEDLIIEILICLPLISILRFRCVCKSWYKILDLNFLNSKLNYDIKNENFRLLVTKRKAVNFRYNYSIESKSLVSNEKDAIEIVFPFKKPSDGCIGIVGSCNGLVCAHYSRYIYYIWNPRTAEYKVIRSPFGFLDRFFGFGYNSKSGDYNFVSVYSEGFMDVSQVEIYTLGSDSWKTYNSYVPYRISANTHGVFLNGALHWLGRLRTSKDPHSQAIISMDMEDGVFKEIPQPEHMDVFDYKFVDVLRGCLCLLCSVAIGKFEIWEMKDYGVRESWFKVFQIDQKQLRSTMGIGSRKYILSFIRRAVSLRNREILLQINEMGPMLDERVDIVKIHLEETKTHQHMRGYEYMNILEMEAYYVESLVSVNSGTFVGNEEKDYYDVLRL